MFFLIYVKHTLNEIILRLKTCHPAAQRTGRISRILSYKGILVTWPNPLQIGLNFYQSARHTDIT